MSRSNRKVVYAKYTKVMKDGSKKIVLQAFEIRGSFRIPIQDGEAKEPTGLAQFPDVKPTYKFQPKKRPSNNLKKPSTE